MAADRSTASNKPRKFVTTQWSLVLAAGAEDRPGSAEALEQLCRQYWYPLYVYARRRGHDADEARDLTQAFFAKLLEKRNLQAASPDRGRFRTFLLSAMKNFLTEEWRKGQAEKRGGAVTVLSIDFDSAEDSYKLEPYHDLSPEVLYQRRWALSVLEQAVTRLRHKYAVAGKSELFLALKNTIGAHESALNYTELSRQLGLSEGALRTAASRLRRRWRQELKALVAETVDRPSKVQHEMQCLVASVSASR